MWGTSRYVYNHRNPLGLALIVLVPLIAVGGYLHLQASSTWSRDELRAAVRGAAASMEREPHVSSSSLGYGRVIEEAVDAEEQGPPHGGFRVHDLRERSQDTGVDPGAGGDYEVTSKDAGAFCLHIEETRTPESADAVVPWARLVVTVDERACPER